MASCVGSLILLCYPARRLQKTAGVRQRLGPPEAWALRCWPRTKAASPPAADPAGIRPHPAPGGWCALQRSAPRARRDPEAARRTIAHSPESPVVRPPARSHRRRRASSAAHRPGHSRSVGPPPEQWRRRPPASGRLRTPYIPGPASASVAPPVRQAAPAWRRKGRDRRCLKSPSRAVRPERLPLPAAAHDLRDGFARRCG